MRRVAGLTVFGMLLLLGLAKVKQVGAIEDLPRAVPAFTHSAADDWINSPPLKVEELRGRVVLIDFWTFDCWNCYRSFPWLNDVETRFGKRGLSVIGVHSPEFKHERERSRVEEKVEEFDLHHPVMMDNDFSYWQAMKNRYWPAFYLVDKNGNIRNVYVGETHIGDSRARTIESAIEALLAEDRR